ncbi:MAG: AlpA family phage regulatory protein [Litorimonas sp.]
MTIKDILEITGIKSRSAIWSKSRCEDDNFPRPYKYGCQFTRWKLSEIESWIDSLEPA